MTMLKNWLVPLAVSMLYSTGTIGLANAGGIKTGTMNAGIVIGPEVQALRSYTNPNARYTCGAAKVKIALAGYGDIKELSCTGNYYSFTAWIDAHRSDVGFNAVTGEVIYY